MSTPLVFKGESLGHIVRITLALSLVFSGTTAFAEQTGKNISSEAYLKKSLNVLHSSPSVLHFFKKLQPYLSQDEFTGLVAHFRSMGQDLGKIRFPKMSVEGKRLWVKGLRSKVFLSGTNKPKVQIGNKTWEYNLNKSFSENYFHLLKSLKGPSHQSVLWDWIISEAHAKPFYKNEDFQFALGVLGVVLVTAIVFSNPATASVLALSGVSSVAAGYLLIALRVIMTGATIKKIFETLARYKIMEKLELKCGPNGQNQVYSQGQPLTKTQWDEKFSGSNGVQKLSNQLKSQAEDFSESMSKKLSAMKEIGFRRMGNLLWMLIGKTDCESRGYAKKETQEPLPEEVTGPHAAAAIETAIH